MRLPPRTAAAGRALTQESMGLVADKVDLAIAQYVRLLLKPDSYSAQSRFDPFLLDGRKSRKRSRDPKFRHAPRRKLENPRASQGRAHNFFCNFARVNQRRPKGREEKQAEDG